MELNVFTLLSQGMTDEAIQAMLHISAVGLRIYKRRVCTKLGVNNPITAINILKEHRWI
ncbi:MAG TPA: LuxR C-terminal-related transcriptional regulator [Candidatus Saccharimonadales bacterium]|nr:LuxR C-terminal-related transcriptional regulator [Candidatus Saccharimonadales bacterium]